MKSVIVTEWIGHDLDEKLMSIGERPIRRPWLAQLTLNRRSFDRRFMSGRKDYSNSNSKGSRGVTVEYIVENGAYELKSSESWSSSTRQFLIAFNGDVKKCTKEEAERWLSEGLV